jgi:hypothetical protein
MFEITIERVTLVRAPRANRLRYLSHDSSWVEVRFDSFHPVQCPNVLRKSLA